MSKIWENGYKAATKDIHWLNNIERVLWCTQGVLFGFMLGLLARGG